MPNVELAKRTLAHIEKLEDLRKQGKTCERWDQGDWGHYIGEATLAAETEDCGTAMCFAGWACKLAGETLVLKPSPFREGYFQLGIEGMKGHGPGDTISRRAAVLLDLPREGDGVYWYDDRLFSAGNDLDDLRNYVQQLEDGTYGNDD